jgi:energy-coupling factor transport system ATP-binding protein
MNKSKVAYDDKPCEIFKKFRELEAIGLGAPQMTYIMDALKEQGFDVDPTALTVEAAKKSILKALEKKHAS